MSDLPATPLQPIHLKSRIAFVGGGHLARALLTALLSSGCSRDKLSVFVSTSKTAHQIQSDFGVHSTTASPSHSFDVVIWAVPPSHFPEAAQTFSSSFENALHISVMAGVSHSTLVERLNSTRISRVMPNLPSAFGCGVSGVFLPSEVSLCDREMTHSICKAFGAVLILEEETHLDAITVLSGSGPAYVLHLMEAMIEAGCGMGLTKPQSQFIALHTFSGTMSLAHATPDLIALQKSITSHGGITQAGFSHMASTSLKSHFLAALHYAHSKTKTLFRF
jgi:pyrroline-5-carboxylate reductase